MTLSYRLTTFLQANPVYTVIVGVFAYAVISNALRARFLNRNPKNLPRPPGPKGYPLIGNLFDMRKGGQPQWVAYDEWFKKYGALRLHDSEDSHLLFSQATWSILNYSANQSLFWALSKGQTTSLRNDRPTTRTEFACPWFLSCNKHPCS